MELIHVVMVADIGKKIRKVVRQMHIERRKLSMLTDGKIRK